jgi:hypothetical protein
VLAIYTRSVNSMRCRPREFVRSAFALGLLFCGCAVYPVLIPPEATPAGTLQLGGFAAAGGKGTSVGSGTVGRGVFDLGIQARLGLAPGLDIGARGSLGGGGLADIRYEPLRGPVSLSVDAATFYNRGYLDPLDFHVPVPFNYRGVRPSVIAGFGWFYCGAACSFGASWGEGYSPPPTYDTLVIPALIVGAQLGRRAPWLIEAELFQVRGRPSGHNTTDVGFCLGFAGLSVPLRLWGEPKVEQARTLPIQ